MDLLEQRYVDLIDRNGARIRRICRSWSRHHDVADLEAEVFLQLWRSLPSFEGRANIDTWAYRVTLNVAMRFSRKERSRAEQQAPERDMEPSVPAKSQQQLEQREQRRALSRAVASLNEADKSMIALWLEEVPYEQIAEITGLSENHVGVRVHRIKKRLAQLMEAEARS